jgi:L-arabinose isomerase
VRRAASPARALDLVAMKALGRFEAWFLCGSQHMYGEEQLRCVEEHAARIAAALDEAAEIPVRVVGKPVATTPDSIRQVLIEAGSAAECVGVIVWMHTFSPAKMWIAGLGALSKPLLHLHTQFNRDLPWAEIDMNFMNLNQAAHGDREFAFMETRMGIARKTVVGHWSDPAVRVRIGAWSRAACGWRDAQSLLVARFGDNMRQVAVTEGDKVEAQVRLGVTVSGYGVGDLVEAVNAVADTEVDGLAAEYESRYELAPELAANGPRRESLRDAARIEGGLRALLESLGAGAFSDTFEDLHGLKQLPGIAVQRLMADGYGFAGEGDWKTAALVRVMKTMATGLPGGTSFMEDYTYHLAPGAERILGAHMLEVCPSLARGRPSCEIHPLSIGGREDPVRLVFTAPPGRAVNVGMIDLGDRFRLIANEVEIVEPDQELPRLPVARALWRPEPDFATAAETWLTAGGPHHTALSTQLGVEVVADFARIAGIELLVIDERTRSLDFEKELRWNQAYYHLARGL